MSKAKRITLSGNYLVHCRKGCKTINIYKDRNKSNKRVRIPTLEESQSLELGEHVLAVYAKHPKSFMNVAVALMVHSIQNNYVAEIVKDEKAFGVLQDFYRHAIREHYNYHMKTKEID